MECYYYGSVNSPRSQNPADVSLDDILLGASAVASDKERLEKIEKARQEREERRLKKQKEKEKRLSIVTPVFAFRDCSQTFTD